MLREGLKHPIVHCAAYIQGFFMLCIVGYLLDSNEVLRLRVKLHNSLIPLLLSHHPYDFLQSRAVPFPGSMEEALVSNELLMVINVIKVLQAYLNEFSTRALIAPEKGEAAETEQTLSLNCSWSASFGLSHLALTGGTGNTEDLE